MSDDTGSRWTGWLRRRRGSPWWRACQADTIHQCARQLFRMGDELGLPSYCRCLTLGAVPDLPQDGRESKETARKPAEEPDAL
jgi:hypothetical protein